MKLFSIAIVNLLEYHGKKVTFCMKSIFYKMRFTNGKFDCYFKANGYVLR